jgi:argininosuccinate lyase
VGDDVVYDQKLLGYDIRATKAHCHMLASVGLLTQTEATQLSNALDALRHAWEAGEFTVTDEYEDGHSAIEAYLTDALGTVGKKVHTARSRNDQALVMMRLYLKDMLAKTSAQLDHLADAFVAQAHTHQTTPMPGYTHTQKAMPTTVGAWLGSFGDALHDQAQYLTTIVPVIDQNPLGSAAGFGVSLPLDRAVTTRELGFAKTQQNPMYCGLSRGIFELMAVQALVPSMTIAGKFATDMLLFTAQEYGFFGLPASLTTGSSIMPHKHNYDVFEIVRANAHSFGQYTLQLQTVAGGVGSGYHRDLQLTKKPTVDAFTLALATLEVLQLVVSELVVYPAALKRAMTDELLSVQRINELVATGVPFRDAYHQVKQTLTKTHQ